MRCRKGLQPLCAAISLFVSTTSVKRVLTKPVHQNVTHGRGSRLCNECNAAVDCYILAIFFLPFGRIRGRCGTLGLETYSMRKVHE